MIGSEEEAREAAKRALFARCRRGAICATSAARSRCARRCARRAAQHAFAATAAARAAARGVNHRRERCRARAIKRRTTGPMPRRATAHTSLCAAKCSARKAARCLYFHYFFFCLLTLFFLMSLPLTFATAFRHCFRCLQNTQPCVKVRSRVCCRDAAVFTPRRCREPPRDRLIRRRLSCRPQTAPYENRSTHKAFQR